MYPHSNEQLTLEDAPNVSRFVILPLVHPHATLHEVRDLEEGISYRGALSLDDAVELQYALDRHARGLGDHPLS